MDIELNNSSSWIRGFSRFCALLIVAILLISCAGSNNTPSDSGSSPSNSSNVSPDDAIRSTLASYASALKNKDYDIAYKLLSDLVTVSTTEQVFIQNISYFFDESIANANNTPIRQDYSSGRVTISGFTVEGISTFDRNGQSFVQGTITFTMNTGLMIKDGIQLIQEGGNWKVSVISARCC